MEVQIKPEGVYIDNKFLGEATDVEYTESAGNPPQVTFTGVIEDVNIVRDASGLRVYLNGAEITGIKEIIFRHRHGQPPLVTTVFYPNTVTCAGQAWEDENE